MQQLMNNYRTMFLFRGLAAIIFGILMLVWPRLSLAVLVFIFGIFAVINGITAIVAALRNREEPHWDCSSSRASWVSWRAQWPWCGPASPLSPSSS